MATSIKIRFPQLWKIGNKELLNNSSNKKIHGLQNLLYKKESANAVHLVIAWVQHVSGLTTPILEPPHTASKYVNSI